MALIYKYQVWLTDPLGVRLASLNDFLFMNYQRFVNAHGAVSLAYNFDQLRELVNPYFAVDRRLEVWRAPVPGGTKRLEDVYWLRRPKVYTRKEDGVNVIEMSGRNAMALLDRRVTPPVSGTSYTSKTDYADDMMKEIVRENLGNSAVDEDGNYDANRDMTLTGQFSVQPDVSLGPSISKEIARRNVFDVIQEIARSSADVDTNLYFDIVPLTPTSFQFQTFIGVRGTDRTNTMLPFSVENGSLDMPYYEEDYWYEANFGYGGGSGIDVERVIATQQNAASINASPWGRSEIFVNAPNSSTTTQVQDEINAALDKNKAVKRFISNFISHPGGDGKPRTLYGLDWDLGDRVPVNYAGKNLSADIVSVQVSINNEGKEKIVGRNVLGE